MSKLGVWPVSMLVPWLLNPFIGRLSLALQALFIAAGIVILLTWVGMPVLVRILRPWLNGAQKGMRRGALLTLSIVMEDLSFKIRVDTLFNRSRQTLQPKGARK